MADVLITELKDLVGADHVLEDPQAMAPYLADWRKTYTGRARCVVFPTTAAITAKAVAACYRQRVPMVPQGGNTGLVGGATPQPSGQEVLFCFQRLNQVRSIDPVNNSMVVESGCTLSQVQQAALSCQRLFPLTLASQEMCQIGGNLSTNAGGVNVLRYGNARDLALGLEVVLPDGQLWDGLFELRKNNMGYDLKQLFIGAEGTLGMITAASLKLFPIPGSAVDAWLAFPSLPAVFAALDMLSNAYSSLVNTFELMSASSLELVLRHIPAAHLPMSANASGAPWHVLLEISGNASEDELRRPLEQFARSALGTGAMVEMKIARTAEEREHLWRLRLNMSEAQRLEGPSVKHDIALPISQIVTFLTDIETRLAQVLPNPRPIIFGHLGDGNIHFNLSPARGQPVETFFAGKAAAQRLIHDRVIELGGSLSAEHGLGQAKTAEVQRYQSPLEISLRRSLKATLDPLGLMNPGKTL